MIEIIPAIDILDGKCVRLSKGEYASKKIYSEKPLEVAKAFEDHGLKRLHVVDLDGAKSNHIVNFHTLYEIASNTSLTIDFGGGIKGDADLHIAFDNGASMVTLGSIAVRNPETLLEWIRYYGADRIILGADVKNQKIAINGWEEESEVELNAFLKHYTENGIRQVLCTDINRDGLLQGPSIELYQKILEEFPGLYLMASGGVSSLDDIYQLEQSKVSAVVLGKAIYERKISLKELEQFVL
jgi:phosphoribosylformimino-5-aminoimidazole carboxamide ribotide isomerase